MFIPMQNMCARVLATDTDPERLELYQLAARFQLAPGKEDRGSVWAISAETGEAIWLHEQPAGTQAVVATGGGLVFGGDANGRFKAFDQETGAVLWEINLGSPVLGFPITYAVDGKQYVVASTSDESNLFVFALPD
jgi:alcohol dehydrogenase (cytochrome c)